MSLASPPASGRSAGGAATAPLRHRADIDGLRAVAIVPVLLFHAFPQALTGGFVGVDVFFVISGYLISQIILVDLRAARFRFADFYARRARRLFPSLSVVLAAALAAGSVLLLPEPLAALGRQAFAGAAFASNLLLAGQSGYFDADASTQPLLHLWSLGVEEQFYFAWPLLLVGLWRCGSRVRTGVVFALALASFAYSVHLSAANPHLAFYSPLTRWWELMCGCLLACLRPPVIDASAAARRSALDAAATPASLAGLAAIVLAAFALGRGETFPGWAALLPALGATLLIAAGPAAAVNRHLLARPLMTAIGRQSFQLYLWHWPLLVFAQLVAHRADSAGLNAAAIAASFPLAWLTYRYIDLPLRTSPRRERATRIACIGLGAAALLALVLIGTDGLPARFPADIERLRAFAGDQARQFREGTCFLRPDQGPSQFGDCSSAAARADAPSVLLWGDSHAAHLYSGLAQVLGADVRLEQRTASLCAPLLDINVPDRPHCREVNDFVLHRIEASRADVVILAAIWAFRDWRQLRTTIERLQAANVPKIVVVGPMPFWPATAPTTLWRHFQDDGLHRLPHRLREGLIPDVVATDRDMAAFLRPLQVDYVSPLQLLCNADGCLLMLDERSDSLTTSDQAHLTAVGSRWLVEHFPAGTLPRTHARGAEPGDRSK